MMNLLDPRKKWSQEEDKTYIKLAQSSWIR